MFYEVSLYKDGSFTCFAEQQLEKARKCLTTYAVLQQCKAASFHLRNKIKFSFPDWSDFVKFAKISLRMTSASKIYPALTLEVMVSREEGQYYDVKSAQKKPSELADIVSAYANAEGGTVVIGISDKTRRVEGVNAQGEEKINNFLNIPKDCCIPMPEYRHEMVDVTNDAGKPDRVILLHIKPSIDRVISTSKDDVFLRIGDKTLLSRKSVSWNTRRVSPIMKKKYVSTRQWMILIRSCSTLTGRRLEQCNKAMSRYSVPASSL